MLRAAMMVLFVAGTADGAPVPKAAKKSVFPLKAGYKWEYVGDDAYTMEVTGESDLPNKTGTEYEVTYTHPKSTVKRYFTPTPDALLLTRTSQKGVFVLKSPTTHLKLPLASGANWERAYQYQNGARSGVRMEAGTAEAITVQGREYKAFPVKWEAFNDEEEGREWYVEGVGLVRKERGGATTSELKAFTEGGPKKK